MTKENTKHKVNSTKLSATSSNAAGFDTFLKNQQNIVSRLKNELKSVRGQMQLSDNGTVEKDKYILELEYSNNQHKTENQKLNSNLQYLKEENSKIFLQLNSCKEKFYQLETEYDKSLNEKNQEIDNLRDELQTLKTSENQTTQELSMKCQDLQQILQDNMNELEELKKIHAETLQNSEEMKVNVERQRNEFELYKKQFNDGKRVNEERTKQEIDNLKVALKEKDDIIQQCISDKNSLEKEKNLVIDELNNKIYRIEKAFSQPTKVVQPMVTLPQQIINHSDNSSNSEGSHNNVAIPQVRKPLENLSIQTMSNNANQKGEQNQMQRSYKFKRPVQPTTSSQQQNAEANRKRRNQPLRQPLPIKSYNEFSFSSSDENDDNESNYNGFSQTLWRPNNECYVADTDTSEGFAKPKRSKK